MQEDLAKYDTERYNLHNQRDKDIEAVKEEIRISKENMNNALANYRQEMVHWFYGQSSIKRVTPESLEAVYPGCISGI